MRIVWLVLAVAAIVACRSAPKSEPLSNAAPPPATVSIELDNMLRERLAAGLPLRLEMHLLSREAAVGACTLSFDLWEEQYRVALSRSDVMMVPDPQRALRLCIDQRLLHAAQPTGAAHVIAREAPVPMPIYEPPTF